MLEAHTQIWWLFYCTVINHALDFSTVSVDGLVMYRSSMVCDHIIVWRRISQRFSTVSVAHGQIWWRSHVPLHFDFRFLKYIRFRFCVFPTVVVHSIGHRVGWRRFCRKNVMFEIVRVQILMCIEILCTPPLASCCMSRGAINGAVDIPIGIEVEFSAYGSKY